MTRYVYAIGSDWQSPVKIGVATDLAVRLAALQTGNPVPLQVLWSCEHESAYGLENHLHTVFANLRLIGEWFAGLEERHIVAAVDTFKPTELPETEQSEEALAATAAVVALVDIAARRHGLSVDLAMDHVARTTKIRRPTLWHLRYRKPEDVWVSDYHRIALAVWSAAKQPIEQTSGNFVPDADELRSMTEQVVRGAFRLPNEPEPKQEND